MPVSFSGQAVEQVRWLECVVACDCIGAGGLAMFVAVVSPSVMMEGVEVDAAVGGGVRSLAAMRHCPIPC